MPIEINGIAPLLQVFHMPTSLRFYRDTLGFTVTGHSEPMSGDPDDIGWCMMDLCGSCLMLNTAYDPEETPAAPDPARWSGHQDTGLFIGAPDVDAVYRYLLEKGLALDPPKVAWYGMKQLCLKDPDGFGICFQWQATEEETAAARQNHVPFHRSNSPSEDSPTR
jgi:catechol 2,3-dioxygenase-like lactoylglutathione lyase family enzyme